jgi:hypothetical protein
MPNKPDIGVSVQLGHIGVQVDCGAIIAVFSFQSSHKTCLIAHVCAVVAIADLTPEILATLGTTATEEQIVIEFVTGGCSISVEDSRRGTLQTDNDGLITLIGEDMTSQAIPLPTKSGRSVVSLANILPVSFTWYFCICVCCHYGKIEDCSFVRDVGPSNLIHRPVRGIQDSWRTCIASILQISLYVVWLPIGESFNLHGGGSCSKVWRLLQRMPQTILLYEKQRLLGTEIISLV